MCWDGTATGRRKGQASMPGQQKNLALATRLPCPRVARCQARSLKIVQTPAASSHICTQPEESTWTAETIAVTTVISVTREIRLEKKGWLGENPQARLMPWRFLVIIRYARRRSVETIGSRAIAHNG